VSFHFLNGQGMMVVGAEEMVVGAEEMVVGAEEIEVAAVVAPTEAARGLEGTTADMPAVWRVLAECWRRTVFVVRFWMQERSGRPCRKEH
jgi:hypothetical protein